MIRYYKRLYFFKIYDNWFECKYNLKDLLAFNVYWHVKMQGKKKVPMVKSISHTVELALNLTEEEIFSKFSKQIRQQSRIAENEGITVKFNADPTDFINFFNEFAAKKNNSMVGKLTKERIDIMGRQIEFCFALYNGQVLAAHSYLVDRNTGMVRHQHSATKRLDENFDRNLIGRANKYLTVKNILHYKEQGYATFDFGGYAADTTDESLAGINKYKLLFGGDVVPSTNYHSYSYWVFKKLYKMAGLEGTN